MAGQGSKVILLVFLQAACILLAAGGVSADAGGGPRPKRRLKILFYTSADAGSHHLLNTRIGEVLVARGHEVTFLLSSSCTKWRNASGAGQFGFEVYRSTYTAADRQRNLRLLSLAGLNGDLRGLWRVIAFLLRNMMTAKEGEALFHNFHYDECDSLLGDSATKRRLEAAAFDLLVGEDLSNCNPLIAEMLGIPFVLVSGTGISPSKGSWYGLPRHPAYIPERQLGYSDIMGLSQRVLNTYMYAVHDLSRRWRSYVEMAPLQRKYGLSPGKSFTELLARAQLWIFSGDFGLEYARPLQPNVVLLPSLMLGQPTEAIKIPADQQEFMDSATEGAVIFTLGGHVTEMKLAQAQMFADGLARLRQRVLWQFSGNMTGLRLGPNTKLVDWFPQQQIMAHPNSRAFLSHGGLNGMYEAAWYGLPVVGVPLFGDNFDNVQRAEAKGFGLQLDITTLTADVLSATITRVIEEPSFRAAAQHLSEIFRDQPLLPAEKAAFWIAHVGLHGGAHLRPRSADLTWVEHNLIDVYAALAAILALAAGVLYLVCRGCLRCACACLGRRPAKLKTN